MDAQRNMWSLGFQAANNPSVAKQFLHSPTIHGLRREFGKKAGFLRTGQKIINKATGFIPVPYVADLINKAMDIAASRVRSYRIRQKKGAADSTDPSLEKLVKFTIKELNVSEMDRYRLKIKEAQEDFAKATQKLSADLDKYTADHKMCSAFFKVAEKRGYVVRRLVKMRAKTAALREICAQTEKWCAEVESNVNGWQRDNSTKWKDMIEMSQGVHHEKCGDDICVVKAGDGPQGPSKAGQNLCKLTHMAVEFVSLDELGNFGVDEGLGQI